MRSAAQDYTSLIARLLVVLCVCAIYKAAISSSIDKGCISGTDVGPPRFPSIGVSVGPVVPSHLLLLRVARPEPSSAIIKKNELT